MRDALWFLATVLAFALATTAHGTIAVGLLRRRPRWHAAVALVLLPMAPYWALRERMRVRAMLWMSAVIAYVLLRLVQRQ